MNRKPWPVPAATADFRIKLLVWFSGLNLSRMQRLQKPLSRFLNETHGLKRRSQNVCKLTPCARHQYARGVCAYHYRQLAKFSEIVSWSALAALGLCNLSKHENYRKETKARAQAKLQVSKAALSGAERKFLNV